MFTVPHKWMNKKKMDYSGGVIKDEEGVEEKTDEGDEGGGRCG
jgi:hypothetical protein